MNEPFSEIIDRLLTDRPEALPLGDDEVVGIIALQSFRRPYSTSQHFELQTESVCWRGYVKIGVKPPTLEADSPSATVYTRREFEMLQKLHGMFADCEQLGVVKPVAYYPEYPALITEESPGRDLLSELQARLSFYARSAPLEAMERACRLCGQWLVKFQAATAAGQEETFSLDEMRKYNDRRLMNLIRRRFRGFNENRRKRTLNFFDSLAQLVAPEELRVAGVHGDFGLGNVLISDGRIVVLDFPMCRTASVLHDVTHFDHHLRLLALHPRFTKATARRLRQAFLKGYDSQLDMDGPLFRLLQLQHALCQLSRLSHPPREPLLGRLYNRYVVSRQLRWLGKTCNSFRPSSPPQ